MDNALSTLPSAINSANRLNDKLEALKKEGPRVKSNMASLQSNINICREIINKSVYYMLFIIYILCRHRCRRFVYNNIYSIHVHLYIQNQSRRKLIEKFNSRTS